MPNLGLQARVFPRHYARRRRFKRSTTPASGSVSLAELVATSTSPKDALWAGSPDVCPATRRLVHDAMGCWTPARHFLFHAGVRRHVRVVLLCGNRGLDPDDVPAELWQLICSFFGRSDWAALVA